MRIALSLLALIAVLAFTGCAGPERKFGRGMNNLTEVVRGGELRRSVEQTALWEGPEASYTIGFIRGLNRTVARTAIGAYEVVSAPFPPYGPLLTSTNRLYPDYSIRNSSFPWGGMVLPEDPVFPDNYRPTLMSDSLFSTDTSLGFSGGDVAPMVPGSRFHIFDNY
jgi:putative exosortase-associated protein (TIGR04073 family)